MSDAMVHDAQVADQGYHYQTARETFDRILHGVTPWVAIGDFLDDWRRAPVDERAALVADPIANFQGDPELRKWAALCAGIVEWLCWNDHLPFPSWTSSPTYDLPEPWFLYPGWRLRAWQLISTPTPFKMRNIFGGDRMLDRV
ncbi:MAG TPA: hypothetical protein VKQ30_07255 [Ktedonobacterales bacterium]|nr:hypothetical protein [Ktedonobacterales bacterium]